MVGSHWRHPAPVIDPGGNQRSQLIREVGRCLQVDVGRQHQAGGGNGPQELVGRARGVLVHRGARFGQEVLDDHLLDVAVPGMAGGDGLQGVEAVLTGLADADEEAGGERDAEHASGIQCGEASGGDLVRSGTVGVEVAVGGLDHHPLTRRHRAQGGELVSGEGAGVGMGEETGLLEHGRARRHQVLDRRGVAVVGEPFGGRRVPVFGTFAQGEEGLVASGGPSGLGDSEDVVELEVGRLQAGRSLGECAVSAPIPAQHRQRDEHLRGERHPGAEGGITHGGRTFHQLGQRGVEQCGPVDGSWAARHGGTGVGGHLGHLTGGTPTTPRAGLIRARRERGRPVPHRRPATRCRHQ